MIITWNLMGDTKIYHDGVITTIKRRPAPQLVAAVVELVGAADLEIVYATVTGVGAVLTDLLEHQLGAACAVHEVGRVTVPELEDPPDDE